MSFFTERRTSALLSWNDHSHVNMHMYSSMMLLSLMTFMQCSKQLLFPLCVFPHLITRLHLFISELTSILGETLPQSLCTKQQLLLYINIYIYIRQPGSTLITESASFMRLVLISACLLISSLTSSNTFLIDAVGLCRHSTHAAWESVK